MTKLSAESYRGSRDWYPEDLRIRKYIFQTWRQVVKKYGYEEYDAPLLEPIEVYEAKSGQELVGEQTYQFVDRGDRRVAIRPEMTPSVSRMIAARRQEIAYPARWFSIAQFMRYERPQRGREREFWQLNVDLFGVDNTQGEAELIAIGSQIMKAFGATDDMYVIRVNNRRLIDFMMAHFLGLDVQQAQQMIRLFDRKNKIPPEVFRDQAIEIFGADAASVGLQKIAQLLTAHTMADLPEEIRESEAVRDVQRLFTLLERSGVTNAIFDITLMRGLDYYTGTVFEFFDTHPDNNRALFGGGRYDGLVGVFGAEPVGAVGFAPGLSMMELFLEAHDLMPEFISSTDIYMIVLGNAMRGALEVADELRDENVNVEVDFTGRKLDKQIKSAVKKQIPYMMFVGEEELENEIYTLKNIITGDEQKLSLERVVTAVKDHRRQLSRSDDDDDVFDV